MVTAPYTMFGKTLEIPVKVYINGVYVDSNPHWDCELWVEDPEDWYSFMNQAYKDKRVRVVRREAWVQAVRAVEYSTISGWIPGETLNK